MQWVAVDPHGILIMTASAMKREITQYYSAAAIKVAYVQFCKIAATQVSNPKMG